MRPSSLGESVSPLQGAQRDYLRNRLRGGLPSAPPSPREGGAKTVRPDRLPLSSAQERLWFVSELDPRSVVYNTPVVLHLRGPLQTQALHRAFTLLLERHEALRTRIVAGQGVPHLEVDPARPFPLEELDFSAGPPPARELRLREWLGAGMCRPFALGRDLMIRATLIRLAAEHFVLAIDLHHIASDLRSWEILLAELAAAYAAFAAGGAPGLPSLKVNYADHALRERAWLASPAQARELEYWTRQLAGAPELLELPTDRARPAAATFRGAVARAVVPGPLAAALQAFSRREGATQFMTLLAAFQALLHRWSRQDDLVVGIPAGGREQPEMARVIGLFVNTLPMRARFGARPSFRQLLAETKAAVLDGLLHQTLPFDRLVDALRTVRTPGHFPLVQVMFTFQAGLAAQARLVGVTVQEETPDRGTARFDLTLVANPGADGVRLDLEYNTDLFDAATAGRMLDGYLCLLSSLVDAPEALIDELPLVTPAERRRVVEEFNSAAEIAVADEGLHAAFERQAQLTPAATALVCGSERLTYSELDRLATSLAAGLCARGLPAETPIAVFLRRTPRLVIALLAILKAGGAYVALDPAYPAERLQGMLEDCGAPLMLTETGLLAELPPFSGESWCVDRQEAAAPQPAALPRVQGTGLAYIIYTSGSTGRPKGVCLEHRNAVAFLAWAARAFSQRELSSVLAATSVCFDLSIFEFFAPLSVGGTMVLVDNVLALAAGPPPFPIRLLNTVPSAMREILRIGAIPSSVETVNLAGELLPPDLVVRLYSLPHVRRVCDLYGPTETTTYSTWTVRRPEAAPSIGRPIDGTRVYVLDAHRQPLPTGVPGELFIGGAGVARGYWGRPDLTSERFVTDPFSRLPDARLYRTGDLGRWRDDGSLECLGRLDHQVKVRGFRVELGEVEATLLRHPAVGEAAVAAPADLDGVRQLVAYVVAKDVPAAPELRAFLRTRLPESMVPARFVFLPALPRTPNGKVDRKALPAPPCAVDSALTTAPRDERERSVAEIWQRILGRSAVDIHDSFFDLGGNSLLAVRLTAALESVHRVRIPLAAVFQAPTVAAQAALLAPCSATARVPKTITLQARGELPPLFLAHGMGGGGVWGYQNIARHLGEDQPIYALPPDESLGPDSTIEEMAARHLEAVRAVRPNGPYWIGGYCFGGNVAYEMARQLAAAGEPPARLVLVSSWPANRGHDRIRWRPAPLARLLWNVGPWLQRFCQWNAYERQQFLSWKWASLRQRLGNLRHGRERKPERVIGRLVDLGNVPQGEKALWDRHYRALQRYRPQPYPGRLTLLRTRSYPLFCSYDPLHGWQALAKGGVEVRFVTGWHETILTDPDVASVAARIRALRD